MITVPRKIRRSILLIITGLIALWLGISYFVAVQLVRRAKNPFTETGITLSNIAPLPVALKTGDGLAISGSFFAGKVELPIVMLLHGTGRSRKACLPQAKILNDAGYSVLLISQRAHGESDGKVNDFGYSARFDVIAAVDWLKKHHPKNRLIIWGQSMGAAAAIFAADDFHSKVDGYILECPYRDLKTATNRRLKHALPPVLSDIAYAGLLAVSPAVLPNIDKISPVLAASKIPNGIPVLVMCGAKDYRAPPDEGQEIAKRIGQSAEFRSMPNAEHVGLLRQNPEQYREWIMEFLQRFH